MQSILIFLAYFFICVNGLAQPSSIAPTNLSFQNFTTEDGLSDNYINHIYQDSRGFIWLSTPEGLNRFDGTTFKKFYAGKQKGNSLPSSLINAVIEYKKNFLLISTGNGMVTMNTVDQQFFTPADTILASGYVSSFLTELTGNIWLALIDRILLVDSMLAIKKMILIDKKIGGYITNIHRLKSGKLIIATTNGYYYVDEGKNSFTPLSDEISRTGIIKESFFSYYDELSNSLYTSLYHTGLCRIGLDDGSVKIFESRPECKNCLQSPVIYSAMRNMRGQLWISSFAGLVLFDEKKNRFLSYTHHSDETASLVNNQVTNLFEDREKNLWVGTQNGLSKLNNSALTLDYYKKELEINGNAADLYDITKGSDSNLYVATYGNGVFSIKPSTREIKNFGRGLIAYAWSVNKNENNIVVTGHNKKMYRLDISSGKTQPLNFLEPYQNKGDLVLFAYTDSRGGRWYSINHQQGLFYFKPGASGFTRYSNTQSPAPFPQSYFNCVTEDNKGRLWFGVNKRSELVSYDFNSNHFYVDSLKNKTGLLFQGLTYLLADSNLLWIGTYGTGLIRFEPDTRSLQVFTIEDGLSSNHISFIVKDNKKRLWVGTRKGLSFLAPGQQHFISFAQSNGLPETDFNEGSIYYDSTDNRIYAGAKQTLISINPDEFLNSSVREKPLLIDEILVNNKKINLNELTSLKLPHNQNNLQFSFTCIDFENPGSINYYYKLEGADKDWIASGRQRSASYANLPAGTYRFLVKTIKPGNSSEVLTILPFSIHIAAPWWQTWWFRSGIGVLGIGILVIAIRFYYRRKLEKEKTILEKQQAIEKERTRIATDMHDDLGAGLSRIKFLSETIGIKKQKQQPIEEDISKIREYSHEMIDKMGEIVWALNEKNDSLSDLLSYSRAYAMEYLSQNGIKCIVETPDHFPVSFVSGEFRRNIYLTIKEALHNVVKHAQASEVTMKIITGDKLDFSIQDNGIGFDNKNIRPFSNGLINMEKRIKEIGGKFIIINEKGTFIKITVPLQT